MKIIQVLLIIALLVLLACSKDTLSIDPSELSQGTAPDRPISLIEAMMDRPFATDFIVSPLPKNAPARFQPTEEEFRFMRMSSKPDPVALRAQYPEVKAQLLKWSSINAEGRFTSAIQDISLRYLRNLFLLEPGRAAEREVEFLLHTLMATDPIDLDVLVDAYLRVRNRLDREDRSAYLLYIRALHDRDFFFVRDNFERYKQRYEESTGVDRQFALLEGRNMERKSHACLYARERLGFPMPTTGR